MHNFTQKQQDLIDMVLRHEGGYSNNANDKGKETYCGISRVYHPQWQGWDIIDKNKPLKTNQKVNSAELLSFVYDFYLSKFYNPLKIDSIENLSISGHLFCHGVNAGIASAVKIAQKAINNIYKANILVDGKIGNITLSWLNKKTKQRELIDEIITLRKNYYESIVRNKPTQLVFLKGWINRVNSTTTYCEKITTPQALGFANIQPKKKKKENEESLLDTVKIVLKILGGAIKKLFEL